MANGKIYAIRVQNVQTSEWFEYDNGLWNKLPEVTPGTGYLYIAVYVQNKGTTGYITLIINVSGDSYYIRSRQSVAANGYFGAEGTWNMPSNNVTISINITDT